MDKLAKNFLFVLCALGMLLIVYVTYNAKYTGVRTDTERPPHMKIGGKSYSHLKDIDNTVCSQPPCAQGEQNAAETSTTVDGIEDDREDLEILLWEYIPDAHWHHVTREHADKPVPCENTTVGRCACACRYTKERDRLNVSAAVMGDVRVYRRHNYNQYSLPEHRQPGQYWVLYNNEFLSSSDNDHPILTSGLFNLSATYQREADIHLPYGECHQRDNLNTNYNQLVNVAKKKNASLWFVSHCLGRRSLRNEYAAELQKYSTVDIRGECSPDHKTDGTTRSRFSLGMLALKADLDTLSQFKFYLAFENTYCKDYVTEKAFKVLQDSVYTVPIVRGYGPYTGLLPAHSFIDTASFSTPKQLAEYLTKLINNDILYKEYYAWREKTRCYSFYSDPYEWPCRVCKKICDLRKNGETRILRNLDIFKASQSCFYPKHIDEKPDYNTFA